MISVFLPGVDFSGIVYGANKNYTPTGDFTTDQAGVAFPGYGGAMFVYTVNKNNTTIGKYTLPNVPTDTEGSLCFLFASKMKYVINLIKVYSKTS